MTGRVACRLTCLFLAASSVVAAAGNGGVAITPEESSRFLSQATLGADWDEIHRTADVGFEAWLEEQFDRPIGYQQPFLDERIAVGLEAGAEHRRWAWWQQVMHGPDPLRQRVALALSEHVVV